jgi:hypothetical protein
MVKPMPSWVVVVLFLAGLAIVFSHSVWRGYHREEPSLRKPNAHEFVREDFRQHFQTVMSELTTADDLKRHAVGYGINFLTTAFISRFGSLASFKTQPHADQMDYLKNTFALAEKRAGEDPGVALGFRLFGMYLTAQIANDEEVISEVAAQLASLSQESDIGEL